MTLLLLILGELNHTAAESIVQPKFMGMDVM